MFFVLLHLLPPSHRVFCCSTFSLRHKHFPVVTYLDLDLLLTDLQKQFFSHGPFLISSLNNLIASEFQKTVFKIFQEVFSEEIDESEFLFFVAAAHRFDNNGNLVKLSFRVICNLVFSSMKVLRNFVAFMRVSSLSSPIVLKFLSSSVTFFWRDLIDTSVYATNGRQLIRGLFNFKSGCPDSLFQVVASNFNVPASFFFNLSHPQNLYDWGLNLVRLSAQSETKLTTQVRCKLEFSMFLGSKTSKKTPKSHFTLDISGVEKKLLEESFTKLKPFFHPSFLSITGNELFLEDCCVERVYYTRGKKYFGFFIKAGFYICPFCKDVSKKCFAQVCKSKYFTFSCVKKTCGHLPHISLESLPSDVVNVIYAWHGLAFPE